MNSSAYGINNSGQAVGYAYTAEGYVHATLWSNGGVTVLGTLGGGTYSVAYGINDSGQVVGRSSTAGGPGRAMLWTSSDGMIDLTTLMEANSGFSYLLAASAINDKGQIVGYGETIYGDTHAFLMTPTGSPVPVPGAVWLLGSGIAGLAGFRRSRRST